MDRHSSANRGWLLPGLFLLAIAIATAATVSKPVGGVLLIVSWALVIRAIHLLGRSGPA
ncbi:MAG: hypothetical protein U0174_28575 [Polyangiaceae bacterium]